MMTFNPSISFRFFAFKFCFSCSDCSSKLSKFPEHFLPSLTRVDFNSFLRSLTWRKTCVIFYLIVLLQFLFSIFFMFLAFLFYFFNSTSAFFNCFCNSELSVFLFLQAFSVFSISDFSFRFWLISDFFSLEALVFTFFNYASWLLSFYLTSSTSFWAFSTFVYDSWMNFRTLFLFRHSDFLSKAAFNSFFFF